MRQKEIINIKDGKRYGFIADIDIDEKSGKLKKIIVPANTKVFGIFGKESEYSISWTDIKQIGDDIILIDIDSKEISQENND